MTVGGSTSGLAPIVTAGLTKHYGKTRALVNLNLTVQRGEIFGFLGPNGAGKTTTIRLLLGLLRPTSGAATIEGYDVRSQGPQARRYVSYQPSNGALYTFMTAAEYLETFARMGGEPAGRRRELAERLGLDLSLKIKSLSHGNRQKVAVIRALQREAPLYLLDEPTGGLDPLVQVEFGRILREYRQEGRTVFLSTHVLSEAESLCDRVGILRQGTLVTVESVAALKRARLQRASVTFAGTAPADSEFQDVKLLRRDGLELEFEVSGPMDKLIKTLANYEVLKLTTSEPSLEEVFLHFYGAERGP